MKTLIFEGVGWADADTDFKHENDPRKGIPYVARLTLDEEGKLKRDFYNMNREYGKKSVLVYGKFTAKEGDIVEQRIGGSWKNDYRYWYLVTDGKLEYVADIDDAEAKAKVIRYLSGEMEKEELIKEEEKNK